MYSTIINIRDKHIKNPLGTLYFLYIGSSTFPQEAFRRKPTDFCSSECLLTNISGSLCLESSCKCWLTCDISTLCLLASIHCHGRHMFLFVLVFSLCCMSWLTYIFISVSGICCCLFCFLVYVVCHSWHILLFVLTSGSCYWTQCSVLFPD